MTSTSLQELIRLVGLPSSSAADVTITGGDPILPTPYSMGAAGAAALGAVGAALSEIWAQATGRRLKVTIDTMKAVAALRSYRYLQVNGGPPTTGMDVFSGFYPVQGGRHIFLHCNFPHHREINIRTAGSTADPLALREATAKWDGEALETAIHEAGGCAAYVRTHDEWDRHPHARAMAKVPLVEVTKIADAPPRPLPAGDRPLSGIRVLDLTRVLAGPTCAKTLAEHGAEVLKITRQGLPDSGLLELDTGLGKRSAYLDLREDTGLARMRELLAACDVFSQSYRPGALAARGLSPERLAEIRPGIVYVTLSAWGPVGPWSGRRGFDTIVQSATGMAHTFADAKGPRLQPVSAIDYVVGYSMAAGAMAALARRAREGGSWLVRASLLGGGRWIRERGSVDLSALPADASERLDAAAKAWVQETTAPDGRITHLGPVLALSETTPGWALPPVPLGHDAPNWSP